ncbi:MAG: glutaredoxin family protein [Planctomycetota bacterium]
MTILGWLFGRKRNDLHVIVYTRRGCHLCDDAWEALERLQTKHQFHLAAKDVDADPDLVAQFDTCVPVIEVNGRVRMRGRFNAVLFQRLLDAPS